MQQIFYETDRRNLGSARATMGSNSFCNIFRKKIMKEQVHTWIRMKSGTKTLFYSQTDFSWSLKWSLLLFYSLFQARCIDNFRYHIVCFLIWGQAQWGFCSNPRHSYRMQPTVYLATLTNSKDVDCQFQSLWGKQKYVLVNSW